MSNLQLQHKECLAISLSALAECFWNPGESIKQRFTPVAGCFDLLPPEARVEFSAMQKIIDSPDFDWLKQKVEHTRLFVGPFKPLAPPYGSLYLEKKEGKLMGDSTLEVQKWYSSHGLELAPSINEPADFIALEIEFLIFLLLREIDAVREGNLEQSKAMAAIRLMFLETHPARWMEEFSRKIEENAEGAFFVHLARLTLSLSKWASSVH